MKCPSCKQKTDAIKRVISREKIIVGCPSCLPSQLQQGDSAKFNREWDKKQFRKDITQPNQGTDFIRAYGIEKSREFMSDETIRKLA